MNSEITLLDRNSQPMNVELICYFGLDNKKYAFYTKNEMVQDGLIKMYVAEENTGIFNDISQDEWNNLKKVMQGIITGNGNTQFLSYNTPLKFNEAKAIALTDLNIKAIKSAYKNSVVDNAGGATMSNKDLLSQSFGNNVEPAKVESIDEKPTSQDKSEAITSISEPVQISSIPGNQNTFNMESTPVNLSTESSQIEINNTMPTIEPINNNSVDANVPQIDVSNTEPVLSVPSMDSPEPSLNINSIKPSGIDSSFKVSDKPNIFDQPQAFTITEQEINKPLDNSNENNLGLFNQPVPNIEPVDNAINTSTHSTSNVESSNVVSQNIVVNNDKKIELNEKKIKLFEELANIYREENELLKKESSFSDESELEKTASNLFNSNGTLNENEVLN